MSSDSSPDSLVCVYAMAAVDVDASQLFFKSKAEKQRRAVCQVMCMNYSMRGGTDYHSQAIVAQESSDSLYVSRSWDLWFMRVMVVGSFPLTIT